jgi:hypothetical protein
LGEAYEVYDSTAVFRLAVAFAFDPRAGFFAATKLHAMPSSSLSSLRPMRESDACFRHV